MLTRRCFIVSGAASLLLYNLGCRPGYGGPAALFPIQGSDTMRYTSWNTWCVGRVLVDLPAGAGLVEHSAKIDGHALQYLKGVDRKNIRERVQARVEELKHQKHKKAESMYLGMMVLPGGSVCIKRWIDNISVRLQEADVFLASQDPDPIYCAFSSEFLPDEWDKALAWYSELTRALRVLPQKSVPTGTGFCGDGFFLMDTPSPRQEYARLVVQFPGYPPGLLFVLETATSTPSRVSLEKELDMSMICGNLSGSPRETESCETLRKGRRPAGNMSGFEVCVAGQAKQLSPRLYAFAWQTPGKPYDHAAPIITADLLFNLGTNQYKRSFPGAFSSDQEALNLWDTIVRSIRLRSA